MPNDSRSAIIVLPSGEKGGAESVAAMLAEELSARGWKVLVYAMCRGEQPLLKHLSSKAGIEVITRNFRREIASVFPAMVFLAARSRADNVDLCYSTHLHVNSMTCFMRRLGILRVNRLVIRESTSTFVRFSGVKRWIFSLLYRLGYGRQDLLVFQTEEMATSLVNALGPNRTVNAVVLPNPVRLGGASHPCQGATAGGVKRIVACGRLVPVKAFITLVRAFASLPDDLRIGWVLEIIGDGPEKGGILSEIERLGIQHHVRMLGAQPDPAAIFSGAQVGVISSVKEGFPNVLLEMMASGVSRIVSTPCFGGCFAVEGLIVSKDSSAASLGDALRFALLSVEDRSEIYMKAVREKHSLGDFASVIVGDE